MTKSQLLLSTRGTKGGYRLSRSPENISIMEISMAIEGKFGMTVCSLNHEDCDIKPYCLISSNWQLISKVIYQALDTISLAHMAGSMSSQPAPLQTRFLKEKLLQQFKTQ
jgi:Rrf2 family protein